ncbi:xanthine phosphoribosyltransferase [Culicoidibacter larvae]|uniref:Xanthine phosphoribosyltransferase n=1 Tax=Culicoidibacter larvae TaxID=2579976 RepID=A0A5R8QCD3_9FIRM|nr:xanthine phosphoribosyltransferase [Culicoidibacter larvae]TLG74231.1 xanthine phosphoribosyltransferase [Culicoidibacter larvae]
MELLKQRIETDGIVLHPDILKVDTFLNHQIDVALLQEIGAEFARIFAGQDINKILTVESSGIAFAVATSMQMENIPVVFARKQTSKILKDDFYATPVHSYTKNTEYKMCIDKRFLTQSDRILILDDFLAHGQAVLGLIRLAEAAGAKVIGAGIVIEKSFQNGRSLIEEHIPVHSLARIEKFADNKVFFVE